MKLLLIEDEKSVYEALLPHLKENKFEVTLETTFVSARIQKLSQFDIVILDWSLPDGTGLELLKMWRQQGENTPVIMLTARNDITDKVLGLELGAHDYVTKPFDVRELIARIRVQLRQDVVAGEIHISPVIKVDRLLRKVFLDNREISFTRKEFDLLVFLAQSKNQVYTRDELLNRIWGFENFPTTRTVDTHVLQIRNKLGSEIIETVHGIGYRMKI